ncbi:hypothetical protein GCM10027589_01580 [Actinocorallia lasiicapitis]
MSALKWPIVLLTCAFVATLSWYATKPGVELVTVDVPPSAATSATAQGTRVPAALVGSWSGNAVGPAGRLPVALTLQDGAVGEVVGESSVPGSGCVFELKLESVDRNSVQVTEKAKAGKDCTPSSGRIALRGSALRYSTHTSSGELVTGLLDKA